MIPLSIPNIVGNEWKYVKSCLDTNWVSSAGQYVQQFEQKICEYNKVKNAISCVNGTAALHIALQVVGVKSDDEVLVPTLTFIAPVNVIRYVNAQPIFMDCDHYYNIDIEKCLARVSGSFVRGGFAGGLRLGIRRLTVARDVSVHCGVLLS